jgi:23S rRNA pseudouridine1911/1915/1917 synthase
MGKISVVYENKHYLVLNKPTNLVVNKSLNSPQDTLQDWIYKRYEIFKQKSESNDFFDRCGIVHRLDKETSGLILVAKDEFTFINLQNQFKVRLVQKEYYTLVYSKISYSEGEINAPIGRSISNRRKFTVISSGREALTKFSLIKVYNINGMEFSLLNVKPLTGRTHQIRVHLKYIGYPVVGDKLYANPKLLVLSNSFCSRLFLHCHFISFKDPQINKQINFSSDLPKDLKEIINHQDNDQK